MSLISERDGNERGNFNYLFGDPNLALLFSRAHGAMVSLGTSVERYIWSLVDDDVTIDLKTSNDYELAKQLLKNHQTLIAHIAVKPKSGSNSGINVDYVLLDGAKNRISLFEFKLGNHFDTGKRYRIVQALQHYADYISSIFNMSTDYYVCSFLEEDRALVAAAWKPNLSEDNIIMGRDFCERLGIDYDQIMAYMSRDQAENRQFVFDTMRIIGQFDKIDPLVLKDIDDGLIIETHWCEGGVCDCRQKIIGYFQPAISWQPGIYASLEKTKPDPANYQEGVADEEYGDNLWAYYDTVWATFRVVEAFRRANNPLNGPSVILGALDMFEEITGGNN